MSQAIQAFTPPPPSYPYQGNPQQQQVSAVLASSSSGLKGDSIEEPVAIGVGVTVGGLFTVATATLAVKHFSTSGDKPQSHQSSSLKPVERAEATQIESAPTSAEKKSLPQPVSSPHPTPPPTSSLKKLTLVRREIHYYPQIHYTADHEKYKKKYNPEVAFLQRSILDDLSSRRIEDVFSESLTEINHGKIQETYKKIAEFAFKEYEPGQNLTEPQKYALGGDGADSIYPYMPTTTWAVTTHPTESDSLYEERKALKNKYFNGMDRRLNGQKDGTNSGPSEQDIARWKSEYEKVLYDVREECFANALRDFFKNNPTKKRVAAIMGVAHVKLPALIEKKIPGSEVIEHNFIDDSQHQPMK